MIASQRSCSRVSLITRVDHVIAIRSEREMSESRQRILADDVDSDIIVSDASAHVARMEHDQSSGDRCSARDLPCDLMRGAIACRAPIAIRSVRASPEPAIAELGMLDGERTVMIDTQRESIRERSMIRASSAGLRAESRLRRTEPKEALSADLADTGDDPNIVRLMMHGEPLFRYVEPPTVPAVRGRLSNCKRWEDRRGR